jgi:tRNA threonylcarbamoyl adenosine modification protein YeaZ
MRCLYLDVASHGATPLSTNGLVACVTEKDVVAATDIERKVADHELLSHIERALQKAGWSHGSLTCIACVTGPGGFTSLRVGVSAANALAFSLTVPLGGVHLSDLYAARVQGIAADGSPRAEQSFLWLHSTKKDALFVRGFGTFSLLFPEPVYITLEELQRRVDPGTPWTGELIDEHEAFARSHALVQPGMFTVQEVLPAFLSSNNFSEKQLTPWYGREP